MRLKLALTTCFLIGFLFNKAQISNNYSILVKPHKNIGFNGLQSYASGQYDGKIILIGGRKEGLHQRQPFAAFDPQFNNTEIVIINPLNNTYATRFLDSLPVPLNEQLQSTNMQFIQNGKSLFLIGGYGYSAAKDAHTTYGSMTIVNLELLLNAFQNGTTLENCFSQIIDTIFAVSGGQLGILNETFYLVGGHKFEGSYNPFGPDNGPGFYQQYSDQIRTFKIDKTNLSINDLKIITDTVNLHRRDFNMLPQIFKNNEIGFTVLSGVFKKNVNIPFTNSVDIFKSSYKVNEDFTQYLNHYACPKLVLYDEQNKRNDNILFGGIAQFYFAGKTMVEDNDVPFTKSITCVSRDSNDVLSETAIGQLKSYLTTGADFFINPKLEMYPNQIIKLNAIKTDSVLLGYIIGGISTKTKNIFWENTGAESVAHNLIQEVWIKKTAVPPAHKTIKPHSTISQLQVYADADTDYKNFILSYYLNKQCDFKFNLYDKNYKLLKTKQFSNESKGYHTEQLPFNVKTGTYFFSIKTATETINRKLIIDLE